MNVQFNRTLFSAEDQLSVNHGKNALLSDPQNVLILAQVAKALLEVGEFAESLGYAEKCYERACEKDIKKFQIVSLCLSSSAHRALARAGQSTFAVAECIADHANKLFNGFGLSDVRLKGKILIELAESQAHNALGNAKDAFFNYHKAMECFTSVGDMETVSEIELALVVLKESEQKT